MKQFINRILSSRWISGLLLISMLIFLPIFLQAREFEEYDVRVAVETWIRYVTADARPDAVVERMEPHKLDGKTVAYIAHLTGDGFCLCGADDLVLPVYLYCPQGKYDPQNPDYQFILWEIDTRLKYLREGLDKGDMEVLQYQQALSERDAFWRDLIAGRVPDRIEQPEVILVEPDSMVLGLTCRWHQGNPYNDQCPLHVAAGQLCVVGCVATAMSQVMYYWQWPNTGVGSADVDYEYRWRNNWDNEPLAVNPNIPGGWDGRLQWIAGQLQMNGNWDISVLGAAWGISNDPTYRTALQNLYDRLNSAVTNWPANFGATTYQWSLMADDADQLPPGGDAAVATLCHHAGVAVGMNYGIKGSGASTQHSVAPALKDHFRYDDDATYMDRDINTMTAEIQWLRPMVIRGQNAGGGHAWVIFGYNKATDPNRQFKMNMGWGGDYSQPPYGWYSCDAVPGGFTIDQGHVIYIAPEDIVRFVGANDPGDGSPDDPYEDIEEANIEAPTGATLIFKAGSVNTFSASSLVINRALTLKGKDVVIRKQ